MLKAERDGVEVLMERIAGEGAEGRQQGRTERGQERRGPLAAVTERSGTGPGRAGRGPAGPGRGPRGAGRDGQAQ